MSCWNQTKKGTKLIQEVIFLPDLGQNLLSVVKLVEHGYAFENDECVVCNKGSRIKMEKQKSFLYVLIKQ